MVASISSVSSAFNANSWRVYSWGFKVKGSIVMSLWSVSIIIIASAADASLTIQRYFMLEKIHFVWKSPEKEIILERGKLCSKVDENSSMDLK